MRAINHALTGALIGLTVAEPVVAMPAALASHFVLDAIPHHGDRTNPGWLRSRSFRDILIIDALMCALLVGLLAFRHPSHWWLAAVCAFLAASPDLLAINRYRAALARKKFRPNLYVRFASGIQWFEKPIGAVVEIAWFIAALLLLAPFLH